GRLAALDAALRPAKLAAVPGRAGRRAGRVAGDGAELVDQVTAASEEKLSSRLRKLYRDSFDEHVQQSQVAVQHHHVGPGAGRQTPPVGQVQVVGGVGGQAHRG